MNARPQVTSPAGTTASGRRGFDRGADGTGRRRLLPPLGLIALCLAVYLPGLAALPPVDRDEARFAQASRQMFEAVALPAQARDPALHDGGLVIPRVQDRVRLNKPPLIYWLQAAAAAVFTAGDPHRDAIWMYRVPSLLGALVAVLITWRLGHDLFDARTGWLGAAMLGVCPLVVWEAHQARADLVLLAWTTLALWALWKVIQACSPIPDTRSRRATVEHPDRRHTPAVWALLFWLAVAGGILTKGPITPLVVGLAALAFAGHARRWRWLRTLRFELGLPLLVILLAPWVWAVVQRVGVQAYGTMLLDEIFGRVVSPREGHWAPPGWHTVLLAVLFWPGSLLTGWAVALAWRAARRAPHHVPSSGPAAVPSPASLADAYRFCLASCVPAWLVFELASTKLPHYTLPLYPPLAVLSARAVLAAIHGAVVISRPYLALIPWLVIGLGLCAGVPAACLWLGVTPSARFVPVSLAWVLGLGVWVVSWSARRSPVAPWLTRLTGGMVAAVVSAVFLFQALLPHVQSLWVSRSLMHLIGPTDPALVRPVAVVEYHEDSLVFLRRGKVARLDADALDGWIGRHPGGLVVAPATLVADRTDLVRIGSVSGYNYSVGRWVDLVVAEVRP